MLALLGVNVFIVLLVGIITAAAIGFITNGYQLTLWLSDINQGFSAMQNIFILALFIGGLSELVKRQGGLAALTKAIANITHKLVKNSAGQDNKMAGIGIGGLAFLVTFSPPIIQSPLLFRVKQQKSLPKKANSSRHNRLVY